MITPGTAYTRQCWGDVLRTGFACALAAGIAWLLIEWIDAPPRTAELASTWTLLITGIELLWAMSYTSGPGVRFRAIAAWLAAEATLGMLPARQTRSTR